MRVVAAVFFSWHTLAMLYTLFPSEPGTVPPARPLDGVFGAYRVLTGARQDWMMFHTAPNVVDLEMEIVARDESGAEHRLGAVLPGFQDADLIEFGRYYHFWARVRWWNDERYVTGYMARVKELLEARSNPRLVDFTLIFREHIVSRLDEMKETRKLSSVHENVRWFPLHVSP